MISVVFWGFVFVLFSFEVKLLKLTVKFTSVKLDEREDVLVQDPCYLCKS